MISVSGLSLRFGKKVLFDSVTLKFRPGLVYGMVGANGAGKTTFLKILSGEIKPSEGQVVLDPGVKMGMLRQDHYTFDNQTVIDTVLMGNQELHQIEKEKDALYAKPEMTEKEAERAADLEIRFGELDGYSSASRAGELLAGLNIETESHNKLMKELTGGWKVRVLLAQILYAKPDLLLLDEPTNALDIASINWLEEYLNDYEGTIIMVSHDRHFLNRTCTSMVDIDRQKITFYPGNYDFFVAASQAAVGAQESENAQKERRAAQLKDFIARFSANASKSKQATSRYKMLEKLEVTEIVPSSRQYPRFLLKPKAELGKDLVEVIGLNQSYGELKVLTDMNFALANGDKCAVLGPNGVGKTTLLRTLISAYQNEDNNEVAPKGLAPQSGKINWGKSARVNYMPQDTKEELTQDMSMVTWLRQWGPNLEEQAIRGFLGRMLFSGEQQDKSVKVLSGGECQRLFLARIMLVGGNVLVLDEPSNHMDLESIESLGKALEEFTGGVIVTSHDQDLIERFANRVLELRSDGSWLDFKGSYAEYQVAAEEYKKKMKKSKV